ncbi:MAG: hypothetical protein GEEBNDBF_01437 [bacterium]|nr:hypothetical protein [bacterium]
MVPLTSAPAAPSPPGFSFTEEDWPALGALMHSGAFRRHFQTLCRYFPSLRAILAATREELEAIPELTTRTVNSLCERLPELKSKDLRAGLDRLEARAISWWDADYPAALRDTPWPPPLLFSQGRLPSDLRMSIAIVGTRRATHYGRAMGEQFARELAGHGFMVISGGAYGIDAAAHRGALQVSGRTIAVFAGGLDVPYPAEHKALYAAILTAGGGILTEFPPGTVPGPPLFPQRNRIVAGLCRATLVVEAPVQSGALITANFALEANREVMVLPGRISDDAAKGSNQLLRDGATLVTSVEDLIEACGLILAKSVITIEEAPESLEGLEREVYIALSLDPEQVDLLAHRLNMAVHDLSAILMVLELKGYVRSLPGQHFVRARGG